MKEDQLHFMNALYEYIMDQVDVGIHAIDDEGKTIIYNRKMREIEAMDTQDVLHKNVLDVFMFPENQNSTLVRALQQGEETVNVKQTYFNNKGTEITTINHTFPFREKDEIRGAVEMAKDVTKIERLMRSSTRKEDTRFTFDSIIGKSDAIQEVIELSKRATRTSSYVLVVGETGTGKELFAQSIHNGSARASAPFISQNCAALPDNLIEGLLFGTTKGAFTGAIDSAGLFEQAEGGTLLLDEINSMNIHLQAKLLRVLQEKRVRRIGGTKDIPINVRIIATINEDPVDAIANDHLRKDLYYRLGVVTIFIPPLRERLDDIPLLIEQFITKYNALFDMKVLGVKPEVLDALNAYHWPGNVRELEHVIEASMNLLLDEDWIEYDHLPYHFRHKSMTSDQSAPVSKLASFLNGDEEGTTHLKDQLDAFEKYYIEHFLHKNQWSISRTAKQLGLSRQSLQYRLKKVGLSSKNE
ncbi:sigma 54-interacting transcriptional regulator [Domibacillus sp. PGB-M46]|uniref:sigma-54 interaction domain-containing protein n=1 Tax=Domibacillus sp. PGB-M46 TaxID=2910255 RepID=UPI001F59980E|nr:sigma 54-interacting transcriptional regulator [Domibacillus sp. PGB-M46]MCI2255679.1 sigma 54-interacting transcriptional regulator [Domibacillus sp. PGB-M46]